MGRNWVISILKNENVITPPGSWKLKLDGSALVLDGDWGFPLRQISEEPCEMYVYEVKGFPELVKIGIAKDSKKRHAKYYQKLLWQKSFTKRTARMVEYLFMHSTYHRAHNSPPPWNVGNFFYDTALPILKDFFNSVGHTSQGITEVRQMTEYEAECTIDYIYNLLINKDVFDAISTCAIKTFNGPPGIRSTVSIKPGQTSIVSVLKLGNLRIDKILKNSDGFIDRFKILTYNRK